MSASEKYVVRFEGRPITKRTDRKRAHQLRERLGDKYDVWNLYTRRVSTL